MILRTGLFLALAWAALAQGPPPWRGEWWDSPLAKDLNLSDAQQQQIRATVREYRNRLVDLRGAVQKSEGELDDIFNDTKIDQRRANDAINRLAESRGELTKTLSQMSLKLRAVLTKEQWQQLQQRRPNGRFGPGLIEGDRRGGERFDGRRRGVPPPSGPPPNGPGQNPPPPAGPPKPL